MDATTANEFEREAAAVLRAAEHIGVLLPQVGASLRTTLAKAAAMHSRTALDGDTLIHGDCKLDHLFVADGALTLIDLDRCRRGDPALDIGKLLADLRWRDATPRGGALAAALLDGYFASERSARMARARIYEGVLLLKIAARRIPIYDSRWADLTTALVSRAERLLDPAGGGALRRPRRAPAEVAP